MTRATPSARGCLVLFMVFHSIAATFFVGTHYFAIDLPSRDAARVIPPDPDGS